MKSSLRLSFAIVLCLASIVVHSFGELLVLKHFQDDGKVESLTCMSKDDNAALVWNEDLKENWKFEAFDPVVPVSNDIRNCAVRDGTTSCVEKWNKKNDWELVNTTARPMGPVFDYRWEGLKEHVLNETTTTYEDVEMGPKSAGSVVFSVRRTGDFHVFVCENKKPKDASCMWITLSGSDSKNSMLKSCGKGKVDLTKHQNPKDCKDIDESQNESNGTEAEINLYEWQTYIMKWSEKTIQIFKANDKDPFLKGTMPPALGNVSVSVRSDGYSRIRFHFYEYFMTEKNNAVISTVEFNYMDEYFCVELLLGLCPDCKLNISLMNLDKETLETWVFSGDENAIYKEQLTWRSAKLEKKFDSLEASGRLVTLKTKTMIHEEEDKGQWAIGNFRTCKSLNKIRKSTVTIPQIHGDNKPGIKCQKLSYDKPDLVDPGQNVTKRDSNKLLSFIREYETQFRGKHNFFGKQYSVCDNNGCICDRGFSGDDCSTECKNDYYGYNCADSCEKSCNEEENGKRCDAKSGYCTSGCKDPMNIPPDCKEGLKPPIVTEITDTGAKISQIVEVGYGVEVNVSFNLTNLNLTSSSSLSVSNITMKNYELDLKNLTSNTHYEVQTVVKVMKPVRFRTIITSLGTLFTTSCTGEPLFRIVPGETNLTIFKLMDKVCGDPEGQDYAISVEPVESGPAIPAPLIKNIFPFEFPSLTSYTEYRVSINKNLAHTPVIFSTKIRTIEAAPGVPRQLTLHFKSHGFVKLTWQPPSTSQAAITKFVIAVNLVGTELLNPPKENMWVFDHTVSEKLNTYNHMLSLPPSSNYEIFISAVTVNNMTSNDVTLNFTVPSSVGFEKKDHKLRQRGTIIEIEYPTVVNATNNTMVSIFVNGYTSCDNVNLETGSKSVNLTNLMVTKYLETDKPKGILKIGAKQNNLKNCSLFIGPSYSITATVNDSNSTYSMSLGKVTLNKNTPSLWHFAWLIFVPILGICLYLVFRLRREGHKRKSCQEILPLSMTNTGTCSPPPSISVTETETETETETVNPIYESIPDVVQNHLFSNAVKIEDFEEYTKEAMASGLLNSQHAVFSVGPTKPCKYGKLTKNLTKNRFPNVIPYDESRVVLKNFPGDSQSDYINASYIQGYQKPRAYIATQGPDANTVKDFWWMIWQEKVRVICMVANVMESGKAGCEQYWPEVKATIKYGDITITNTNHQVFADYTIRTLNLSRNSKWRSVIQLHYTGWPDNGVPMHTQSLVAYMKKLLAIPAGKGPVVVHCSAGIGRTGTIILCDYCIRQAVKEKVIDVPSVSVKLSEDRVNLIGNIQHYLLAHLTIMEAMVAEQTQIPCDSGLPSKIQELRKQLPSDVRRLRGTVWQDRALHSLVADIGSILNNRASYRPTSAEFVPAESPVVPQFYRDSTFDSESNYINAVSVDGVMTKKQYLESHLPSDDTLCEYWRLIADKRIELIVILQPPNPNDSTRCGIMPTDSTLNPVPYIRVQIASKPEVSEHYITEKLLMTDKSGKKRKQQVTVITCTGWGCGKNGKNGKPPAPAALVAIWRATEKIKRKEGPTLVLCHDGVTGCGLYLALSFLLERMSVETECDVISAVRAVRRSRTEFVQSMAQFEYLYDAAVNYYECFQTYANFA